MHFDKKKCKKYCYIAGLKNPQCKLNKKITMFTWRFIFQKEKPYYHQTHQKNNNNPEKYFWSRKYNIMLYLEDFITSYFIHIKSML